MYLSAACSSPKLPMDNSQQRGGQKPATGLPSEQVCGGEVGEKEKQSGSHTVERIRNEDGKAVGTATWGQLLLRATSGSVALPQPGLWWCAWSVLTSKPWGCLGSGFPPKAMLTYVGHAGLEAIPIWMTCMPLEVMVTSRPELQPR